MRIVLLILSLAVAAWAGLEFQGNPNAKHIVLVSGDEEYRSEEALPQLAKILSKHHGFRTTVLFAIDPVDGTINPNVTTNIPGLEVLKSADLLILFTRFRDLPDDQMKHFADYLESGRPIVGIRTATHAFSPKLSKTWKDWGWKSKDWEGGFGKQVLGETWVSHHGQHGKQSTRGIVAPSKEKHPILRGVSDVWGPTDVYTVRTLPSDAEVLLLGQVLSGMRSTDPPLPGPKNNPMMPLAWTRNYTGKGGRQTRVLTTTMGSAEDLQSEGFRRLLVNGAYWALGREKKIPKKANVDLAGEYKPTPFKFGGFRPGLKPEDYGR